MTVLISGGCGLIGSNFLIEWFARNEEAFPLITYNALDDGEIPIYCDGQQIRHWPYVTDHCSAIISVLAKARVRETHNVRGNNKKHRLEAVQAICATLDEEQSTVDRRSHADHIVFTSDRPGHDRRYEDDSSGIWHASDWTPLETFKSVIRVTVRWLDNPRRAVSITSGAYCDWFAEQYA